MAISTTENKKIYQGDGHNRVWPFPFPVHKDDDLRVAITAPELFAEDEWLADGQYQVNGLESEQVEIVYPISGAPLASGYKITILRELALTSDFNPVNGSGFDPEETTRELDRHIMMIQQLREDVSRAAKLPPSSSEEPPNIQYIFDTVEGIAETAVQAKEGAEKARDAAQASAEKSEKYSHQLTELSIAVEDAPYGHNASGNYNYETGMLTLRVPEGKQGVQGPNGERGEAGIQGPQGRDGPEGPQGNSGVIVNLTGVYGFEVQGDDLILVHNDTDIPPNMHINNDGDLIWEGQ